VYALGYRVLTHSVAPEWSRRYTNAGLTGDPATSRKAYEISENRAAARFFLDFDLDTLASSARNTCHAALSKGVGGLRGVPRLMIKPALGGLLLWCLRLSSSLGLGLFGLAFVWVGRRAEHAS